MTMMINHNNRDLLCAICKTQPTSRLFVSYSFTGNKSILLYKSTSSLQQTMQCHQPVMQYDSIMKLKNGIHECDSYIHYISKYIHHTKNLILNITIYIVKTYHSNIARGYTKAPDVLGIRTRRALPPQCRLSNNTFCISIHIYIYIYIKINK